MNVDGSLLETGVDAIQNHDHLGLGRDPGFEPSPTDPLHLVLLVKDIRHTLRGSGG